MCTLTVLVEPDCPGGEPAAITTTSSTCAKPFSSSMWSTCSVISSVWCTIGTMIGWIPQVSESWFQTRSSGVNAKTGLTGRKRDNRRAESPDWVNAHTYLALS